MHNYNSIWICPNGTKIYYHYNGSYYFYNRLDGPAIEYADGSVEYWINQKQVTKEEIDRLAKLKAFL